MPELLELEAVDVVILLNITTHWWEYDALPYPRPSIIAKRMNLSTRTVERRISELQKDGFLIRLAAQRKKGKTIRPNDLSGLVEKLKLLSTGTLVRRRAMRRERVDRLTLSRHRYRLPGSPNVSLSML